MSVFLGWLIIGLIVAAFVFIPPAILLGDEYGEDLVWWVGFLVTLVIVISALGGLVVLAASLIRSAG